jgi:hypothetical protein
VRTKSKEFDGIVGAISTISTKDNGIVPLFTAYGAVEENDKKISSHRAAVEASKVSFERFAQGNRISNYHVHFFSDSFFYGTVFL